MPIDTHVTLPSSGIYAKGIQPSTKKTLFDMYSERRSRALIYVAGEGQSIEDTRDALMLYNGEPFGLNLLVDRYLYHWDVIDGLYLTVSVKGECS